MTESPLPLWFRRLYARAFVIIVLCAATIPARMAWHVMFGAAS